MGNSFKRFATAIFIVSLTLVIEAQNSLTWPVRHSMPDNQVVIPEVGPTGAAIITIPLWDIEARGISIPVSLNYSTAGIRVNDIAGPSGLGWSLITGPSISRMVNGLADESGEADPGHDWFSLDPLSISCRLDSLRNYFEEAWDFGPDIFSFSLPGASGSFLFDNSGGIHFTNPHTSSIYVDWYKYDPLFGYCPGFSAIDNQGNTIIFRATETTSTTTNKDSINNHSGDGLEFLAPRNSTFDGERVTAWGPSLIITSAGDTISYSYSQYSFTAEEYLVATSYSSYYKEEELQEEYWRTSTEESFNILLVDTITTPDIIVVFVYGYDELLSTFKSKLTSIEILDRYSDERIAYYTFGHGKYPGDPRLRLDSINVSGPSTGGEPVTYSFQYTADSLYTAGHYGQDYYGYHNKNLIEHMLPVLSLQYQYGDLSNDFQYEVADRNIDADRIKTGVLEKIIYPAGGSLEMAYEPNSDTISAGNIRQAPGLRVSSIKARNAEDAAIYEQRYYYTGLNGFYILTDPYLYNPNGVFFRYYSHEGGDPEPYVTDITNTSTPVARKLYGLPGGFCYETVTRLAIDPESADTIHRTVENYTTTNSLRSNRPELTSRSFWDSEGRKVMQEDYSYLLYTDTTLYGLIHGASYIFNDSLYECGTTWVYSYPGNAKMFYAMQTIPYYLNARMLSELLTKNYSYHTVTGDSLISKIHVEYDYCETLPLVSSLTTSHYAHLQAQPHLVELKQFRYPFDYAGTVDVASTLVNNNILARALDSRSYLNGHLTEAKTFSFTETGQPDYEYRYTGANDTISWASDSLLQKGFTMELRIDYDTLGNPVKASTVNGENVTLWGYGNRYPIAEITGADTGQVFYTGFERNTSATRDASLSRTGEYYLILSGSYQCPAGLLPGNYIMTYYWRSSSSSPWELITENIQLQQSQYASTNKTTGHIDDLRIYPPGSRITTYTWKPCLGKTSETDTNGTTVFYEYDSHGRLFRVLDNRGNIQRTILYNNGR
ncbi:MAG: hypothetical protein RBS37_00290 [Bacteroidales bacterium]|nr:hypothetical protein [Bacteroidales bacterium]